MTKRNLLKIIAIVFLLLMLVGLAFFRKGDDNLSELNPANNNGNRQIIEPNKNREYESIEEEKARIFAGNFATVYYSYTWGNFSNIESQYYCMTEEMKDREKSKVAKMKKETEGQPQRYFTVRVKLVNSEIILLEEKNAKINIDLSIDNFAGAIVQRDTMVWVDENGDYYEGNIEDIIIETAEKSVEVALTKINGEWKVDWIGER